MTSDPFSPSLKMIGDFYPSFRPRLDSLDCIYNGNSITVRVMGSEITTFVRSPDGADFKFGMDQPEACELTWQEILRSVLTQVSNVQMQTAFNELCECKEVDARHHVN